MLAKIPQGVAKISQGVAKISQGVAKLIFFSFGFAKLAKFIFLSFARGCKISLQLSAIVFK